MTKTILMLFHKFVFPADAIPRSLPSYRPEVPRLSNRRYNVVRRRNAFYSKDFFLLDEKGRFAGVECAGQRVMIGDHVEVALNPHCLTMFGWVVDIIDDNSDRYFGVEFGNDIYYRIELEKIVRVLSRYNA